jgi:O-antigen/teichoic acid export membrane protein
MQSESPASPPLSSAAVPPSNPDAGDPPPRESMGKAVSSGFSWLTFSMLAGRVFGLIAQYFLGNWLSDDEFGVYFIAISISALVKVFQDGGVPQVLIQRGADDFDRLAGAGFWLSFASGLLVGGLLAVAAPALAYYYEMPELTPLVWVIAAALPLGAPGAMLRAKLRLDLRFQAFAMIVLGWFAIRHFGSIGLALLGLGAMSMVLPLLVNVFFEWIAGYWTTRMAPWTRPPQFHEWPGILRDSAWVIVTSVFRGLSRTGDYLVLGFLVAQGTLGKYGFGYLITTQVVEMLAANLRHIMFPVLSRIAESPERQRRAIIKTTRMLVLAAAPVSLGLAVTIRPIEMLFYNGKWAEAVPLMQILAVAAPIRMFSDILSAALSSKGEFNTTARLTLLEAIFLMLSAALSVWLFGENLTGIALVIAVTQAGFSIASSAYLLRRFGITPATFVASIMPAWLVSVAAAGIAAVATWTLPGRLSPLAVACLGGVIFSAVFLLFARIALRGDLDDLIRLAPQRVARIVQRTLRLRDAASP